MGILPGLRLELSRLFSRPDYGRQCARIMYRMGLFGKKNFQVSGLNGRKPVFLRDPAANIERWLEKIDG
jgi:hypothetical protein